MRAERAHRAAVQRALRDDASVLGDDLLRRTVYEFEMFVSPPLRRVISRHLLDYNVLPSIEGLASDDQVADVAFVTASSSSTRTTARSRRRFRNRCRAGRCRRFPQSSASGTRPANSSRSA